MIRYAVIRVRESVLPFFLIDTTRAAVEIDRFRSECAAEYAARLLNRGLASVDPHATTGCKVIAR